MIDAREPPTPPDKIVSLSKLSRVWLRRICSFSSSTRASRSRKRTAYVGPSSCGGVLGPAPGADELAGAPAATGAGAAAAAAGGRGAAAAGTGAAAREGARAGAVRAFACLADARD